jgi:hypothetical protein
MFGIPIRSKIYSLSTNEPQGNPMNNNSLLYSNTENSKLETLASHQVSFLVAAIRKVSGIFIRSDLGVSQARNKMKRRHAVKAELHQDIVSTLPLEEKLKLGMYHFMD